MKYLETITVPLASLNRFPGNARRHADAELRESVKEGQYKSLLCRRLPDGQLIIVAGNGTADALEEVGATEAQIEVWDYSDREARRINLKDNRLSDLAKDDPDLLALALADLDGDTAGLGWTDKQVTRILAGDILPDAGDADPDADEGSRWGLIIECTTEADQVRLLKEFSEQGLNVRAIVG